VANFVNCREIKLKLNLGTAKTKLKNVPKCELKCTLFGIKEIFSLAAAAYLVMQMRSIRVRLWLGARQLMSATICYDVEEKR